MGTPPTNPTIPSAMFNIAQPAVLTSYPTLITTSPQPWNYVKIQGRSKDLRGRVFNVRPQQDHSQTGGLGQYHWKLTLLA